MSSITRYHEILYYTLFQDYKSVSPFYCNEVSLTFQHLFFSCEVPSLSIVFALSVTVFLQFIHFCLKHQFLINKCQSAKVGAEYIIDVIDNTVRVTHIHKHSHSPLNSRSSSSRLHFVVIFLISLKIALKYDFGT